MTEPNVWNAESYTVLPGWALQNGELTDGEGNRLPPDRYEKTLHSYELFSMLKTGYSVLTDPRDIAFADQVIAAWAEQGYE